MFQSRFSLGAAAVAALVSLVLAGCPQGATTVPQQADQVAADPIPAVLGETITAAELSQAGFSDSVQSTVEPNAPASATGEPATAQNVPFDSIDVDPNAAIQDTLVGTGGLIRSHGGLTGRFTTDNPEATSDDGGGAFAGRWFAANGAVRGRIRGEFRHQPAGELPPGLVGGGVFSGRYIDADGQFGGFIRGRYGHVLNGRGFFVGYWRDQQDRLLGILKGHWDDDQAGGGGIFRGRWAAFNLCDEAATLPDTEFEQFTPDEVNTIEGLALTQTALDQATLLSADGAAGADVLEEPDIKYEGAEPCIDPNAPYGFLRGWRRPAPPDPNAPGGPGDPNVPPRPNGVLHAHWFSVNAAIRGQLLGRWVALNVEPGGGAQVLGEFNAHYIDRTGAFRGSIHGVYGVSEHHLGVFRGRYFDADGRPLGVLVGRWTKAPDRPGGPLFGMWAGVEFPDGQ